MSFNTSHRIDHLSFGVNIPGKTNPLDGIVAVAKEGKFKCVMFHKIFKFYKIYKKNCMFQVICLYP